MSFDKSNGGFPTNERDACADVGITKEQWFKLPIELRKRWWHETDYGHNKPSAELAAALREGTTMEDPKDKPAEDPKPAEQKPTPAPEPEQDDEGDEGDAA
jgi:hypothetical protein